MPTSPRTPVIFVGHGSPMNAIEDNVWSRGFRALGETLPRPQAILSISAHWYIPGTYLTGNERPETIHDFGGFPDELYEMQYPAPGDVGLAQRVASLLSGARASLREDWGLDHGTWSVLHHLRREADCPVVQLSIDRTMPPAGHLALGRALAPLRDEGVLIMGSGNIVHNLPYAMSHWGDAQAAPPAWATSFDRFVAQAIATHDGEALVSGIETQDGRMSHPTIDHYLPLLYAMGAASEGDKVRFAIEGFDMGSLSMRAVVWG